MKTNQTRFMGRTLVKFQVVRDTNKCFHLYLTSKDESYQEWKGDFTSLKEATARGESLLAKLSGKIS